MVKYSFYLQTKQIFSFNWWHPSMALSRTKQTLIRTKIFGVSAADVSWLTRVLRRDIRIVVSLLTAAAVLTQSKAPTRKWHTLKEKWVNSWFFIYLFIDSNHYLCFCILSFLHKSTMSLSSATLWLLEGNTDHISSLCCWL